MNLFNPAILQPLVNKLNALHVWDDDISRLLSVHPVLSKRLVDTGLRTPIITDYFNAIRSGNEQVYLNLKPRVREQFAIITKYMGFDIFLCVMDKVKLVIDCKNAKHSVYSLARFEYFVAIIHGHYNFAVGHILNDPTTPGTTCEEPIEWLLCGYRYNPELYKMKISESLKNYYQYTFGVWTVGNICKVGGLSLFAYLYNDDAFNFGSVVFTTEDYITSLMVGCDLTPEECETFYQLVCRGENIGFFARYLAKYAAKNGRINALKWASTRCNTDVLRLFTWYDIVGTDCKEMYEWYMDKRPKMMKVKVIYNEDMSVDSMDYLDEHKLAIPSTSVLFAHPQISLERAQKYDYFPDEVYFVNNNQSQLNTTCFWFAMQSLDIKKVQFIVNGFITKHADISQLQDAFITELLSWSIPKHCTEKDFGTFMDGVLESLRIPKDINNETFRRFRERCSCLCTLRSESARRYIERYLAEPFTPHYYLQQAYRLLDSVSTPFDQWHSPSTVPSLIGTKMAKSLHDYLLLLKNTTNTTIH